ncbi:hypothetical protein N9Z02_01145 [Akkermansiaceae bacterium]|nr:hypothetical protein [Akkermansiaceae bacterium]
MKIFILVVGLVGCGSLFADEKVPVRKEDKSYESARQSAVGEQLDELKIRTGKLYTSVTIRGVDNVGIKIMHAGGTARISHGHLPSKMQTRFGFDPDKALEQRKKELERERDRVAQVDEEMQKQAAEKAVVREERRDTQPVEKRRIRNTRYDALSEADKRLVDGFKARIFKIRAGMNGAGEEIDKLIEKADDMRKRANRGVPVRTEGGEIAQETRVDRAKMKRVATYERQINKLREKLKEAKSAIDVLEGKVNLLYERAQKD